MCPPPTPAPLTYRLLHSGPAAEAKQNKKWSKISTYATEHSWEEAIAKWRKDRKLKKMIWQTGVPGEHRSAVWMELSGAARKRARQPGLYQRLLQRWEQIKVDSRGRGRGRTVGELPGDFDEEGLPI